MISVFSIVTILVFNIPRTVPLSEVLFQRTQNISYSAWDTAVNRSTHSLSHMECATQCVYRGVECNAYKYESEERQCELAQVG